MVSTATGHLTQELQPQKHDPALSQRPSYSPAPARELTGQITDIRTTDDYQGLDLRQAVWQQLRALPTRQRAVIVLRYYEQLAEGETAEALGSPRPARRRNYKGAQHLTQRQFRTARGIAVPKDPEATGSGGTNVACSGPDDPRPSLPP